MITRYRSGTGVGATSTRLARRAAAAPFIGGVIVAFTAATALAAGALAPYRPGALSGDPLEAPSAAHRLGTNNVGQDLWSQLLIGSRTSVAVAVLAGAGAVAAGALVGLVGAWSGRWIGVVLSKAIDLALTVPRLPLLILVGVYLGPSIGSVAVAIAITSWAGPARVLWARAAGLRQRGHIRAAVGFGAGSGYVLRRHVAPELAPLLVATFVTVAGRAITLEAGLAFLGVGDLTRPSWGTTLREAVAFRSLFKVDAWQWWLVPPTAAVSVVTLGATLVGTRLEQWANPRGTQGQPA